MQARCFRVEVDTTNGMRNTFKVGDKYFDCQNGEVYVMAYSIEIAAKMIPKAKKIELVGFEYHP
jgi:hypothetical protein